MGCGAGKTAKYEPVAEAKPDAAPESAPAAAPAAAPQAAPAAAPEPAKAPEPAPAAASAAPADPIREKYPEYAKIFDEIDVKKQGFLLIRDVRAALKVLDEQITMKQVRALVHKMDANNDGKVSLEEFAEMSAAIASGKEMNFHGLSHKEYRKLFFEERATASKARGVLKEGIKSGEADKLAAEMQAGEAKAGEAKADDAAKKAPEELEKQNAALREGLLAGLESGGLDAIADQILADREKDGAEKPAEEKPAEEKPAEAAAEA